jgi:hypothetical protein
MDWLTTAARGALIGLVLVQALVVAPVVELQHAAEHLESHLATPAAPCCAAESIGLQGPCDPGGPCRNPRHHHHPRHRHDEALPCAQCLRFHAAQQLLTTGVVVFISTTCQRTTPCDALHLTQRIARRHGLSRAPPCALQLS